MRTILRSEHNNDRQHAGKVFEGFDIWEPWLAIHFTDGTSLLFRSDVEWDDSINVSYANDPPPDIEDLRGLNLIEDDEYARARAEVDARQKNSRRAEYERLKAEFESEGGRDA